MKLTRRRVLNVGWAPEVIIDSEVALLTTAVPFGFHEPSSFTPLGFGPPDGVGLDQLRPEGDFSFSTSIVLSCDSFWLSSLFGELSLKYLSTSSSIGSFMSN